MFRLSPRIARVCHGPALLAGMVLLCCPGGARAVVLYVNQHATGTVHDGRAWGRGYLTVQAGLNAAAVGDEVWVAAGTYVETVHLPGNVALYGGFTGQETAVAQRNVTANTTTIDGGGQGSVVAIGPDAGPGTVLDGFTITGGTGTLRGSDERDGGGIHSVSSSPTIRNCVVTGNRLGPSDGYGGNGGGIYCSGQAGTAPPRILDCEIRGNTMTRGSGGGIYCAANYAEIGRNTIASNAVTISGRGGGVYAQGVINVFENTIAENRVGSLQQGSGYGGGVYGGSLQRNVITRNSAMGSDNVGMGGGVCSAAILNNNVISGNGASLGGGVYGVAPGGVRTSVVLANEIIGNMANTGGGVFGAKDVTRNVIYRNYAGLGGGGVANCATVAYNRITENDVSSGAGAGLGGGVYACDTVTDNIIAFNKASEGAGIDLQPSTQNVPRMLRNTVVANVSLWEPGGAVVAPSQSVISGNIIAFNRSGFRRTGDGDMLVFSNNCVYGNGYPDLFPNDAPSHGNVRKDPKLVRIASGNFHLQHGSPCQDAGDDALVEPGTVDIDGQGRVQGARVDIGADETNGAPWSVVLPVLHVSPAGNDAADGSGWTLAKRTIQNAVNTAPDSGADIWIAEGVFTEQVSLKNGIRLLGGFAGAENTEDQRRPNQRQTVIDAGNAAQGSGTVAVRTPFGATPETVVDGLSLRNAEMGVRVELGAPRIHGVRVSGCDTGVYTLTAWADVDRCVLNDNAVGVRCDRSFTTVRNSLLRRHGAVALLSVSGTSTFRNNTVIDNNAATNRFNYTHSWGIDVAYQGSSTFAPVVENNIVAFNAGGIQVSNATPVFRYNNIYGNVVREVAGTTDPTGTGGNIRRDPALVDVPGGNFHLTPESPCINAGGNDRVMLSELDLDGEPRIEDGTADIGADEFARPVALPGDVNADGRVDMTDVILLARIASGQDVGGRLAVADVAPSPSPLPRGYGDLRVDLRDVMLLLRAVQGLGGL